MADDQSGIVAAVTRLAFEDDLFTTGNLPGIIADLLYVLDSD